MTTPTKNGVGIVAFEGSLFVERPRKNKPGETVFAPIPHGLELLRSMRDIDHMAVIITDTPETYKTKALAALNYYAPELVEGNDFVLRMPPPQVPASEYKAATVGDWQDHAKSQGGDISFAIENSINDFEMFEMRGIRVIICNQEGTEVQRFRAAPTNPPVDPAELAAEIAALAEENSADDDGFALDSEPVAIAGRNTDEAASGFLSREDALAEPMPSDTCCSGPGPDTDFSDPALEMAHKYPQYWKHLPRRWAAIDVYRVCELFPVKDNSGRVHHALKKLLVPGVRTGGKSLRDDIKEARDTLTAWLIDNP